MNPMDNKMNPMFNDNSSPPTEAMRQRREAPKMRLYFHMFNDKDKGIIKSFKLDIKYEKVIKISDLKELILDEFVNLELKTNMKYKLEYLSYSMNSKPISDSTKIKLFFDEYSDIYLKVKAEAKPIEVKNVNLEMKKDDQLKYQTLTKYSFYQASDTIVKVIVPCPGIDKVPKENILTDFKEDTFEIRVKGANGGNYRFGVPKLDHMINPQESSAFAKGDDLIIRLKKGKKGENWSFLYKVKYIGADR